MEEKSRVKNLTPSTDDCTFFAGSSEDMAFLGRDAAASGIPDDAWVLPDCLPPNGEESD